MNIIEPFFLSINYEIFCPKILTFIKNYLNCEQVFISKLNALGEQETFIYYDSSTYDNPLEDKSNTYGINEQIISDLEDESLDYYTHKNATDFDEDTKPLKRAELIFPVIIKTPEIVEITNIKLWGILLIYDYDYLREWQPEEIITIQDIIHQLTIAIERDIIYKQWQMSQEELVNCQVLDEVTGLAKYSSFIDCLDYECRRLAREKQPLSLILIVVNSSQDLSDNTILNIANIIKEEIKRAADLVAYYQKNQFIIMLPNTHNNGALWVNQKVLKRVSEERKKDDDCDYKSSILTTIPEINDSYYNLLKIIEQPLINNQNSENNICNQNLIFND
ncbi:diguanylate cyclase domain-containing protein [Geminocystis sp. GBBB08]|uniref:sensor domain-containing diguanylate cyclase n=1 Tax=Geminocystis sp. GBBB08 TaxID=2604140 RepID=UPI0027E33A14|nr:diguanylate cyclase [Geminocystis sp. GBBB08]MBL1209851.1 diguanylate cyclase [Geminocystis sp. GBBB08]